ncbi:hypothetical protein JQ604_35700 [Bradyrhizobium jicamae]|uniref:hypothetical protein n=1 Tax=Bradyrhizobium jicamae TaxID=280332 RepID=UPI001BA906AE|nr:hypothetical protein [Bradyrhizobium jicamae]MBR0757554.1 hypothetical protein [Bradyrhizobium jicamae]
MIRTRRAALAQSVARFSDEIMPKNVLLLPTADTSIAIEVIALRAFLHRQDRTIPDLM